VCSHAIESNHRLDDYIRRLFACDLYSDLVLNSGDQEWHCHKIILSIRLPKLFDACLRIVENHHFLICEETKLHVHIEDIISGKDLDVLLRWAYFEWNDPELFANSHYLKVLQAWDVMTSSRFPSELESFLDLPRFSDVSFSIEGESFPSHKCILACRSEYFSKLFSSPMQEQLCSEIEIPFASASTFAVVLRVGFLVNARLILPVDLFWTYLVRRCECFVSNPTVGRYAAS